MTSLKRILILTTTIFSLIACTDSNEKKYDKPIKEFSVGQIDYKIYKKSFGTNVSKAGTQLDTSSGYFLQVFLGITNNSNQAIKFDTSMFKLTNYNGQTFSFSSNMNEMLSNIDTSLNGLEVQPKMTKNGFIIFNVPSISDYNLELNNGSSTKDKSTFIVKPID